MVENVIILSGKDWNHNQYRVINTMSTKEDFLKTMGDYLQFEIS